MHDNIGTCIPEVEPKGYSKITVHMIIAVKLDACFTWRVSIVANGNNVDTNPYMTYNSSVSIESVKIVLCVINDIEFQYADVQNDHINSNPKYHVYFYYGKEFIID